MTVVHNTESETTMLVDRIAEGELPGDFALIEDLAKRLVRINARTAQTLAVIVTNVRENHITSSGEWALWASTTLGLQGAYLHHIHRIGKLLVGLVKLNTKCSIQHYKRLFALPIDKLYPLSRLAPDQIAGWLSHYTPEEMSREAIRDVIAAKFGDTKEPKSIQPSLPGFEQALETLAAISPESFSGTIHDEEKSRTALKTGICVFGAALEFQITRPAPELDVELLATYRTALVDAINDIDEALQKLDS